MPSSSLSWQQGLAGRNPAISFLTSAENEMPTTSQGWCPATRTLFLPSSPPTVQFTEPVTARAPGTDLQPHTLLAAARGAASAGKPGPDRPGEPWADGRRGPR